MGLYLRLLVWQTST